jgi:DNA (cytosine-5)-methyltransferase 3A
VRVLSLFDGISCGQIALNKAGIDVEKYYASEIKEIAMKVTQFNYPDTEQIGDVTTLDFSKYKDVDILIGGSPCQDLSIAMSNRQGLKGNQSSLFYYYTKALEIIKPKYFLLENVARMSAEDREVITTALGGGTTYAHQF